jgi:plasmid stability protein
MADPSMTAITPQGTSGSKARAAGDNRSLEAELGEILVVASKQVDVPTARAAAAAMRRRLEGRPHSDSGKILAEERLR